MLLRSGSLNNVSLTHTSLLSLVLELCKQKNKFLEKWNKYIAWGSVWNK